jgi:hypothetical protein
MVPPPRLVRLTDYDRACEKAEEAQVALSERTRLQRKGATTAGVRAALRTVNASASDLTSICYSSHASRAFHTPQATAQAAKFTKELGILLEKLEKQLQEDSQAYLV